MMTMQYIWHLSLSKTEQRGFLIISLHVTAFIEETEIIQKYDLIPK